jgi:dGTPase
VLSHLRFPVEAGRGRRYPEPDHPYRDAFQRDRDRIIHARAFRRLEAKTQVFATGLSDHFRNRLTHTLEVAQISRTVAGVLGLNTDLVEALALAHDLGHPPFGHAGEAELDRQMRAFGDSFDHNVHALRLVETFEQRYARFPGLNLTFEVREGLVKHSRDFEPGEFPELDEYLPGLRPPLEAQLIDLADEIAYDTSDLDDAFTAGWIRPEQMAANMPAFREAWETVQTMFPGAPERTQFLETERALMNNLVTGLLEGTMAAVKEAGVAGFEDVRRFPERLVRFTPACADAARDVKRFLQDYMYGAANLDSGRRAATARLAKMFQAFLERPDRLPENYTEAALREPLHRVICDYIAGMTDTYFERAYSSEVVKLDSSAERTP